MVEQPRHSASSETTLRDLLAVIFRRKWLILGIFGITSVLVGVKEFSKPTTYMADATLLLNRQGARSSVLERSGRALPWTEVVESELEVVKSTPVLHRAQEILASPSDEGQKPVHMSPGQIGRRISTGVIGESNVIFVTGKHADPDVAVAVTNAVAAAYVDYHLELYELPDPSGMIRARADSTMAELERAESRRAALLEDLGVNEVKEEERALVGQRQRLRDLLSKNERDLARVRVELADAKDFLEGRSDEIPFYENTGSVHGSALSTANTQLAKKRGELTVLRDRYTEAHPQVRSLATEVAALEQEVHSRIRMLIEAREHSARALESEHDELMAQIGAISARLESLPGLVREIGLLDSRISVLNEQYGRLSEEAVTSEINRSSFADYSVKVLSPAITAEQTARGDMVRVLLAPILALMAGIGLAFYLENLDHSIANREDVERHVNIPVLASFPEARVRDDGSGGSRSGSSIPFRRRGSGRM